MGYLLKNPRGIIVEIDDKEEWKKFLSKPGFDTVDPDEEKAFKLRQTAQFSDTTPDGNEFIDIHYISPSQNNDGYGTSSALLADSLREYGFRLNSEYTGQKIALIYGYPEAIEKSRSPVNILFSMFESTKLPDEWQSDLNKFDRVIVPSKFCQEAFRGAGIEADVVNLAYNDNVFKYEAKDPDKEPFTFLHYNAFDQRKGWDLVFKAFNEEFRSENVKLILKSTKAELTMPIYKHQYPNIEVIKEPYSHAELAKLLHRSDCFVLPSRGEGFGIPPLEAIATGTPVIIPNAHGFADYFTRNYFFEIEVAKKVPALYARYQGVDVGKMVECSVKSLREQMRFVYTHRTYAFDMARQGAEWVQREYTWRNTGRHLAAILSEVRENVPHDEKPSVTVIDKRDPEVVAKKEAKNAEENSIIFLTEDTQHITGGRYYSWWLATALKAAGNDVIIYTNRQPVFLQEFADYPQPEVRIVDDLANVDVKGRVYVGSPIIGSVMACKLGARYNRPTFVEVFDPFPMMEQYRGQHHWPGWDELIPLMRKPHVNIISLCNTASTYIYEWLMKTRKQVFDVYPCINSKARKSVPKQDKENWVTFISRLDHHKKLDHVLEAVKQTDCELHVITSVDGINFPDMVREHDMEDRVVIHRFATDKEKFEIIKKSRATINGAIFEGFGMWLTESLSCGVPAVCYEYPTFKEIEGAAGKGASKIYFAKYNDPDDLAKQLKKALKADTFTKGTEAFDFPVLVDRISQVVTSEPKIGVITIGLNEEEYIGASLRSMLKQANVEKIAVVEGCVTLNESQANKDGLSTDFTRDEVLDVIKDDHQGKIIYERYGWAGSKSELRNRALHLLGKGMDYIMVVDADEVWKVADFNRLVNFIKSNPDVSVVWYPAFHFWKQPDLIAIGGQWDAPLFRFFKYEDKTLFWHKHQTPVVNKMGQSVTQLGREVKLKNVHFYHYGAMKPEKKIKAKLAYYAARDKDLTVKNTWSEWKEGKPTQWTHGGGSTAKFTHKHPEEILYAWKKRNLI